jgi:hypothetical protein
VREPRISQVFVPSRILSMKGGWMRSARIMV